MEFVILFIVFGIIVWAIAKSKGRSGIGYFSLSLLLSPIIGLVVLLVLGEKKEVVS